MDGDGKVVDWLVKGQMISLHTPERTVNLLVAPIDHNSGLYWFRHLFFSRLSAKCVSSSVFTTYLLFFSSPVLVPKEYIIAFP